MNQALLFKICMYSALVCTEFESYFSSSTLNSTCDYPEPLILSVSNTIEREREREREIACVILKFCFLSHAGAIVGIVLGIIFLLSALITVNAIGVAWFVSQSWQNHHQVINIQ